MDEQTYVSIFSLAVFLILFVKGFFRWVQEEIDKEARLVTDDCFGKDRGQ